MQNPEETEDGDGRHKDKGCHQRDYKISGQGGKLDASHEGAGYTK